MYVHKKLEKNILPLVHAINETGLFTTYSSCEGHFDTENDKNEPAIVHFDANTGVTEKQILNFFGQVLTIYSYSAPGTYADFTIAKIYIPSINDIIDYAYDTSYGLEQYSIVNSAKNPPQYFPGSDEQN